MICMISSNYETALDLLTKFTEKVPDIKFCGVEAEWGNESLTNDLKGISKVFNHHNNIDEPPSLAFRKIYYENYQTYKCENFIISHIDADTIFGIGWISGIFKPTEKFKQLSLLFASMDINGFHNICPELKEKYFKEFEVIMGIINHAKTSLKKVRYRNHYNCTTIIMKTLFKICDVLTHEHLLDKRLTLIRKEFAKNKEQEILLKDSDSNIHIFNKKVNDFNKSNHMFIVVWNVSLSIYGRDKDIVSRYIPEGLPEFLNKLSPGSGGQFSAAGTPRRKGIPTSLYKTIINELKSRIDQVNKDGK